MASSFSDKQFVTHFFNRLQIKPAKNFRQFWTEIESRHGRSTTDALKHALECRVPGATTNEIYLLKNQNLRLSLDFSRYSADLYRRFFDWLVAELCNQKVGRILDIGCDNGIVTCFMALLFPESEVVGVDIESSAITCATELASTLGLTNVSFIQSDIRDMEQTFLRNKSFDLILSVRSFHEIFGEMESMPKHWAIHELMECRLNQQHLSFLSTIRGLLSYDAAQFITFERLPWMGSTVIWGRHLQDSGLYVDWKRADIIEFQEAGEVQEIPVLVCGLKPDDTDLVSDVYQMYRREGREELLPGREFVDDEAEAVLNLLPGKQLVYGLQVDDTEIAMRYELWSDTEIALLYQCTNKGSRKLTVFTKDAIDTVLEDIQVKMLQYYQSQGMATKGYRVMPTL